MTYKLEFYLVYKKIMLINIKSFKNYILKNFFFLWITYIELLIFYTKLTHLVQKLKNLN